MIALLNDLEFDEMDHIYSVKGVVVPSVTQIMRPLTTQTYFGINKDVLKQAAERGTSVHLAAELYSMMGYKEVTPETEPYFNSWLTWFETVKPEVLALEYRTYDSVLWYAGTIDLIAKINGKIAIVDYKTTTVLNLGAVTVQNSAYSRACIKNGIEIEECYSLHLRPEGYKPQDFKKLDNAFDIFLACMKIQNYIKRMV
jgi:hypothetical protein